MTETQHLEVVRDKSLGYRNYTVTLMPAGIHVIRLNRTKQIAIDAMRQLAYFDWNRPIDVIGADTEVRDAVRSIERGRE